MAFIGQTIRASSTPDMVLTDVDCDPSVIIGDWVRMTSLGVAIKALADSIANSNVIGLVEYKATSTKCNIRVLGVSAPLFVGLDVTKEYLLSDVTAGTMTLTAPTASGTVILPVGQPFDSQRFLVKKGTRIQRA